MKQARIILQVLAARGFQAYIVGGAVRDLLLGRKPTDIDICTDAKPPEIIAAATEQAWSAKLVGAAFGSIMIIISGKPYDVTTFRSEEYGVDSHRPSRVNFGATLKEDLSRRDFTMNTLCIDNNDDLVDLFGGLEDLRQAVIRAVGDPAIRFAEDALRMFRAARFAAQLGFVLDNSIPPAIRSNLHRVAGLSVERVRNEIERTLLATYAGRGLNFMLTCGLLDQTCRQRRHDSYQHIPILPEVKRLYRLPQNPRHHRFDVWRHTINTVQGTPADLSLRWAALLHDIAKGSDSVRALNAEGQPTDHGHDRAGTMMARAILERLRIDRTVATRAVWLVANHMHGPHPTLKSVVRWLRRRAGEFSSPSLFKDAIRQLFALYRADGQATGYPLDHRLSAIEHLTNYALEHMPFFTMQLAIAGGDIAAKMGAGPHVGSLQKRFLTRIQAGELDNTKACLQAALDKYCKRCQRGGGL